MASGLTESLSPLLKSSSVRRGSLDLCHKIGNQLLSPRRSSLFTQSPGRSSPSRKNSSAFLNTQALPPIHSYYNEPKENPAASYHYKRRASDSLWIDSFPKMSASDQQESRHQNRRRSLSPQPPVLQLQLRETVERWRSTEYVENQGKSVEHLASWASSEDVENSLVCKIIPPSPPEGKDDKDDGDDDDDIPPLQRSLTPSMRSDISEFGDDVTDDASHHHEEAEKSGYAHHHIPTVSIEDCSSSPTLTGQDFSPTAIRRCSSEVKYDLDENLVSIVASHWNLVLNPDEVLGKGSFGTVVTGLHIGKSVAVKVLKTTNAQRMASVQGEINALKLPLHNHVARVLDVFQLGPTKALIVMERMHNGNLLGLLNDSYFAMNCSKAIHISKQIALALIFCHRHDLLHLDVKPQNVLLDLQNCCKLSDFGNSKKLSDQQSSCNKSRGSNTMLEGTVPYTAPELFKGSSPTEKCDVYSFGITMWHILSREIPYQDENEHAVIFRVVSQGLRPNQNNNLPNIFETLSAAEQVLATKYAQLYEEAWHADPAARPNMTEIHKSLIKLQFFE